MTFRIIDQSNSNCYVNKETVANQTRRRMSHTHTAVESVHRRKLNANVYRWEMRPMCSNSVINCCFVVFNQLEQLICIWWRAQTLLFRIRHCMCSGWRCLCVRTFDSITSQLLFRWHSSVHSRLGLWLRHAISDMLGRFIVKKQALIGIGLFCVFCRSPNEQLIVRESPLTAHDSHPCWARWCIYTLKNNRKIDAAHIPEWQVNAFDNALTF